MQMKQYLKLLSAKYHDDDDVDKDDDDVDNDVDDDVDKDKHHFRVTN